MNQKFTLKFSFLTILLLVVTVVTSVTVLAADHDPYAWTRERAPANYRRPASEGQVVETPATPQDAAKAAEVAKAIIAQKQPVFEPYPGVGPLPFVGGLSTSESVRKGDDLVAVGLKDEVGRGKGGEKPEKADPRWYW